VRWFAGGSGAATMPYDLLRPSRFGATAVAVVDLHGIALGLAAALLAAHTHVRKRRAVA
jgi:hypothetical protein